ncbi:MULTISPECIES: DUF424 family protein [unclassified Haladaptatus]|uniref:DUF424 domain-containing protein n=1 Tax=unclassified Haladaptatus TaxID=2622732 RepID=UPI00209C243A|nr:MULTISPECIES: DUF424 family protein [unclassified Haladaptatus]MCO8242777.1 DUF424 family protein [Haladaptatus sp. AB643]MCO8252537.1 DUF424 family protein [Haladaptatus sp. AB618]
MILKERDTGEGLLVAVCDDDVLGETFENGDLSFTVSEEFYGGDEADEDEVVSSLTRANVANIVGTDAVALAVDAGFVDETNVLEFDSTRHAQFLRM